MIGIGSRKRLMLVVGIACLCAAGVGAGANEEVKEVFKARYASLKAAMAAHDRQAIAAILAPGYESVEVDGSKQGAEQMIQQVLAMPEDPNKHSETTILSVEKHEKSATVVQRYHMTTVKARPDGLGTQAVELTANSTDIWVESGGQWLNQQTRTDEIELKRDGKVVAHRSRDLGR